MNDASSAARLRVRLGSAPNAEHATEGGTDGAGGSHVRSSRGRQRTSVSAAGGSLAFRVLQILVDAFGLICSLQVALSLRIWLNPLFSEPLTDDVIMSVAPSLPLVGLIWTLAASMTGLYRTRGDYDAGADLLRVLSTAGLFTLFSSLGSVFMRELGGNASRGVGVLLGMSSVVALLAGRYALLFVFTWLERTGIYTERVAIIGAGAQAESLAAQIVGCNAAGAILTGVIYPGDGPAEPVACSGTGLQFIGTASELGETINRERIDRLIIANGCLTGAALANCAEIARRMSVVVSHAVEIAPNGVKMDVTNRYGLSQIEVRPVQFRRAQEVVKRLLDVLLASLTIAVLFPFLCALALVILCTSGRPVLYTSTRVGRGGRHFTFYKFRSMKNAASRAHVADRNGTDGHLFKLVHDPRITPLGRFIRRYSLDELPQLFNVLCGSMSLVGPRPLPAEDLDPDGMSRTFRIWAEQRACVPPGITGLWQIRGRSALKFEQMVELDLQYVHSWSLARDARILLETPLVVLTGRGAC